MVLGLRDVGKHSCSQETQAKAFVGTVHDGYNFSDKANVTKWQKKPPANLGEGYTSVHYTILQKM